MALLKSGATLVAYDTFAEGLRHFPADARLRQQLALALARSGASRRANRILQDLVREGHRDEETLGLLARTHKDLSADGGNAHDRRQHLRLAYEHYRDAYALTSGYWSGINAATMALLLNDRENAETLARRVREQCRALQTNGGAGQDAYWVLATLGESALILRSWDEAEDSYAKAAALATRRYGDLASTRRNARLIVQHLQADGTRIDTWLRIPPVVVFAGHLIDRPDRTHRRFPPAAESLVREAIGNRLRRHRSRLRLRVGRLRRRHPVSRVHVGARRRDHDRASLQSRTSSGRRVSTSRLAPIGRNASNVCWPAPTTSSLHRSSACRWAACHTSTDS